MGAGDRRVVWTDAEMQMIVGAALDMQANDPGLSGLPLLRAAIKVLPVDRRRKLVSMAQAKWFARACEDESRRRLLAAADRYDVLAAIKEVLRSLENVAREVRELTEAITRDRKKRRN